MEYDVAPIVIGSLIVGMMIGVMISASAIEDGYASVSDNGKICVFQDKSYKMIPIEEALNDEK